ncbi:hypothetical protein OG563_34970 [Nocardia vinacea]|uniref:Uncharacterized protein n=1 Tax=Nocardia vinacea TaxID=96468 RepID=A0ABZ1YM77_9NOCA|nr:hypothetical protein [Nocardia vinacea]
MDISFQLVSMARCLSAVLVAVATRSTDGLRGAERVTQPFGMRGGCFL